MPTQIVSEFIRRSRRGSSQYFYVVLCECGYRNTFYALSWGGHGHLKCKGCGAKIYRREMLGQANTGLHNRQGGTRPVPDEVTKDGRSVYYAKPRRPAGKA